MPKCIIYIYIYAQTPLVVGACRHKMIAEPHSPAQLLLGTSHHQVLELSGGKVTRLTPLASVPQRVNLLRVPLAGDVLAVELASGALELLWRQTGM